MDSKQKTNSDFRDKTVWIYIVMFAWLAFFNWHRQPIFGWIMAGAVTLFLPMAVYFQLKKRRVRLAQGKG